MTNKNIKLDEQQISYIRAGLNLCHSFYADKAKKLEGSGEGYLYRTYCKDILLLLNSIKQSTAITITQKKYEVWKIKQ